MIGDKSVEESMTAWQEWVDGIEAYQAEVATALESVEDPAQYLADLAAWNDAVEAAAAAKLDG